MNRNRTSSEICLICVLLTLSILSGLVFTTSCADKSSGIVYNGQQTFTFEKGMWLDNLSLFRAMYGKDWDNEKSYVINIDDESDNGNGYIFLWNAGPEVHITSLDYEGNAVNSINVSSDLPGDPMKVFTSSEGSMLVLYAEKNKSDLSYKYSCLQVDKDGTVLKDPTVLALPEHFQAISWDIDSGNNLYALGDDTERGVQSLISLSDSLAFRYEMKLNKGIHPSSLAITAKDDLYLSLFDDNSQIELARVNKDSGKIDRNLAVQGLAGTDIHLYGVNSGVAGGLVMDTGDKLVTFDPTSRNLSVYLSYAMEGITRMPKLPLLFGSGNTILLMGSLENTELEIRSGILRITGTKYTGDRTVLTIGVLSTDETGMLLQNVYLFNNSQVKYRIDVKNYVDTSAITDAESYQNARKEGHNRMNADLMSSADTPDLLCLNQEDAGEYAKKGMLLDLDTLITGESSFDETDYLPNIWAAQESDGRRYTIEPFFSVSAIFGSKKVLGDISGWTVDEFKEVLAREKGWKHVFYDDDRRTMLSRLYPAIESSYISRNTDSGDVEFHPEELFKYFSLIEEYSNELQDADLSVMEQTSSGSTLFLNATISTFEEYPYLMEFYNWRITGAGYPGAETDGPLISSDDFYGISQNSSHRDGAWIFLRFLLSDMVQGISDPNVTQGMPIQVQAFSKMFEWGSARYENGTSVTLGFTTKSDMDAAIQEINAVMAAGCLVTDAGETGERTNISPTVAKDFRDLVGKATRYENTNRAIYDIIREEAEYYFAGSKTKEEVEALIENRIRVYLEEKG